MNTRLIDTFPAFSILGPPGCGKGTQANLLEERLNYSHISTGEVLRHAINHSDPAALKVKNLISQGKLAPDDLIRQMLENELQTRLEQGTNIRGIVLDGFPRSTGQSKMVDQLAEACGMRFMGMVNLEVPEEMLVQRLLKRGQSDQQRPDDTEEVIKHRMEVYYENTYPLIDFFDKRGQLFCIDGKGSMEEVFNRLVPVIEKMEKESLAVK